VRRRGAVQTEGGPRPRNRTSPSRTMAGMAAPRGLAEQCRGMIPRRVVAWIHL
jgi:hypothetical protein